jgi:ABC-type dipeptide/oligopeptide/nickel transport system permease subunit
VPIAFIKRLIALGRANKRLSISVLTIGVFSLAGALAPIVAPFDPTQQRYDLTTSLPGWPHVLGTDDFGRDILSRIIWGAGVSLRVSGAGVCVAALLGIPMGTFAGFYGKLVDTLFMRFADIVVVFPPIFLALALVSLIGSSVTSLVIVVGTTYFPRFARLAYISTKTMRTSLFVEASVASGASDMRIVTRHVVPNILTPLVVQACLGLGSGILLEGGLSFLGYGVQPPTPSWGLMISSARAVMTNAPLVIFWPSLALTLCVFSVNVVGDALRDLLDPRARRGTVTR